MIKLSQKNVLGLTLAIGLATSHGFAHAEKMTLLTPSSNDMTSQALTTLDGIALPAINKSKERVTFSQVLSADATINTAVNQRFVKESRNFQMEISGAQLNAGVNIPVASESAVIRVIPMKNSPQIDSKQLKINANGRWMNHDEAFATTVNENQLRAAGLESPKNTIAVKMKATPSDAGMMMKSEQGLQSSDRFNVMVFEPNSNEVLKTRLNKSRVVQGETIRVRTRLTKGSKKMAMNNVSAYVMAPNSNVKIPVELKTRNNVVIAKIDTSKMVASAPGLWEVYISAEAEKGQAKTLRSAKVGFAVAPMTARLSGDVDVDLASADNMAFSFDVENIMAGRYEVSAVIYGTNANGDMVPAIMSSTAKWLDANGTITLDVSKADLKQAGLSEPLEVRHLKLKDQTRLSELWSQDSALKM